MDCSTLEWYGEVHASSTWGGSVCEEDADDRDDVMTKLCFFLLTMGNCLRALTHPIEREKWETREESSAHRADLQKQCRKLEARVAHAKARAVQLARAGERDRARAMMRTSQKDRKELDMKQRQIHEMQSIESAISSIDDVKKMQVLKQRTQQILKREKIDVVKIDEYNDDINEGTAELEDAQAPMDLSIDAIDENELEVAMQEIDDALDDEDSIEVDRAWLEASGGDAPDTRVPRSKRLWYRMTQGRAAASTTGLKLDRHTRRNAEAKVRRKHNAVVKRNAAIRNASKTSVKAKVKAKVKDVVKDVVTVGRKRNGYQTLQTSEMDHGDPFDDSLEEDELL